MHPAPVCGFPFMRKLMSLRRRGLHAFTLACGMAVVVLGGPGQGPSQEKSARSTSAAPTNAVSLEPCEVPGASEGAKEKARCGIYEVFENRATKKGRRVALKIVVFPATGQD